MIMCFVSVVVVVGSDEKIMDKGRKDNNKLGEKIGSLDSKNVIDLENELRATEGIGKID